MPIKDNREYRSIAIEDFSTTDDEYVVEGYATTLMYLMTSMMVLKSAFDQLR